MTSRPHWSPKERFNNKIAELGTAFLRLLPPEISHEIGLKLLKSKLFDRFIYPSLPDGLTGFRSNIPGLGDLAHPIGLAAGFDKNCLAPRGFAKMGFSFLELGTVTPLAQPGNPKPRLFRFPEERALINRMGFNSDGIITVSQRLNQLNWDHERIPIGINVGKNAATSIENAAEDYLSGFNGFRDSARYIVFNVSSPNTVGLRELASSEFVAYLGERLGIDAAKVWIKLDPDMPKKAFQKLIEDIAKSRFRGVILTNTHRVEQPEKGGMSGHPLAIMSTARLEWAFEVHKGQLEMIASGGILSGRDVFEKLSRGARAVQIYSALVYRGPWVVAMMLSELWEEMQMRGYQCVADLVGCHYND